MVKDYSVNMHRAMEALMTLKAANVEVPKDFPFSKFQFCGCKKVSHDLLVSPTELIDRYKNGDIGYANVEYMAESMYEYFHTYILRERERTYLCLLFEAGRLQGIREERRKHNKRKEGKTQ